MSSGTTAYRQLLRAIRLAFKGDFTTLNAARSTAREKFIDFSNTTSTPDSLKDALAHVQSVTKILRENIVQGRKVGDETYKLNIHKHTERGDNATVKKMDGRVKSFKELKASMS